VFYRTRDADTLEEIGEVFGVRVDDLVEWNNLDATAKIHPRMVLQIFVRKDFDPRNVVVLDPAQVRVVTLGSREFLELEAARRGKKRLVVEARAGDTLAKVGRRYGLTVGDLARINRFSSSTDLQGGQQIVVYSPTGGPLREMARGMAIDPRRQRDREHDRLAGAKVSTTVSARAASTPAQRPPLAAGAKWTAKVSAQGTNRAEAPARGKLSSLRQPTERKLAEVRPVPDKPGTSARPKASASGGASGSVVAIGGKGTRPGEKPKAPVHKADGSKTDSRPRSGAPAAPAAIGSPGKGVSRKPR
jgi:LysM repeat protein